MRIAVFLISMLSTFVLHAQRGGASSPLQVGIGMSANSYLGDLNFQHGGGLRAYPGINFSLQFDRQRPINLMLNTGFARFVDQNGTFSQRGQGEFKPNAFVQTSFFYLDLRLKYFFFPREEIRPFLATGLGFISFNPEDAEGNFLIENIFTRLPEEDTYLTLVAQFPMQAGFQFRINPSFSISLSALYRFVSSDYLDNIGIFGSRRGNDALLSGQAELLFSLGENLDPQTIPIKDPPKALDKTFVVETHDFLMMWEEKEGKGTPSIDQVEPKNHSNIK